MLPQIPQWYLLEKYFCSISESSKLKHLPVSSALGVMAKFLICSPRVFCSLFPNAILLPQIFLELPEPVDWAKAAEADSSLPELATSAEVVPVGSFLPFETPLKVINFYPFICLGGRTLSVVRSFYIDPEISLWFDLCSSVLRFLTCMFSVWFYYKPKACYMQVVHSRSCSQTFP